MKCGARLIVAVVVATGLTTGRVFAEAAKDATPAAQDAARSAPNTAYAKAVPRDIPWEASKPVASSGPKQQPQAKAPVHHDAAWLATAALNAKSAQSLAQAPPAGAQETVAAGTAKTAQSAVREPQTAAPPAGAAVESTKAAKDQPPPPRESTPTPGSGSAKIAQSVVPEPRAAAPPTVPVEPAKTVQPVVKAPREPAPVDVSDVTKPAQSTARPQLVAPPIAVSRLMITGRPTVPVARDAPPVAASGVTQSVQHLVPTLQAAGSPISAPHATVYARPTASGISGIAKSAPVSVAGSPGVAQFIAGSGPPQTAQPAVTAPHDAAAAPAAPVTKTAQPSVTTTPAAAQPPASPGPPKIAQTESAPAHDTARPGPSPTSAKTDKAAAVVPSEAPKAQKSPDPAPREAAKLAARALPPVTVVATQRSTWGRLSFVLHGNQAPAVRHLPDGVELTFAAGTQVRVPAKTQLRETSGIETGEEDGTFIARIRLACNCMPDEQIADGILRLDFRARAGSVKDPPAANSEAAELTTLRETLTARLAALNGAPTPNPPATRPAPSPSVAVPVSNEPTQKRSEPPAGLTQAGPQGVCMAPVDASGWRGPDAFVPRLVGLRAQVAFSQGGAADMAALAEFYLANGLGSEALAVANDALDAGSGPEDHIRLARDADVARLLIGEQPPPDAALLATPANCRRPDAPLWRALAAAAARDSDGASRDLGAVEALLRQLPEPLLRGLAFRIVAGAGNNVATLQAMAGTLRNSTNAVPEDEARRFLLQARIAALSGDRQDYAAFLEHASRFDLTVPGVIAKARLAAIRASDGSAGAARSEAILADAARTYRHEVLGQQAAEQYAELQLRRRDYAAALEIADESAGTSGVQNRESRGASLAVRILRTLFVDPSTAALPDPAERIALFLRYGGYTTPGEKGDDIRLAAARLMLDRGMPVPALDTLRQISESAAATQPVLQMRAAAEAAGGDPAKAVELARDLPDASSSHRIAADATRRMNKPLEAAHLLDDATNVADRARRAGLLFEGEAWSDAASAYADLLRDGSLASDVRDDIARRYALAVAMTGAAPLVSPPKLPDKFARLLAAVPQPSPGQAGAAPDINALRGALERTRSIESLLDPAAAEKPGS